MRPFAQTQLLLYLSLTSVQVRSWTYKYSNQTMGWIEAKTWCETEAQSLMFIQSEEDNNYLKDNLPKLNHYYWIGLRMTEGKWTWEGTTKMLEGNGYWHPQEPNNKKKDEDCVEIYINKWESHGKWNDEICTKQKHALCYKASCFEGLCSKHAQCVENISNYTCKCNPGFTGPKCTEAVQCPSIATVPSNGRMNCSHSTNSYNTICMFSCDEGFELRGSHTTLCDHTGQWTHKTPTCTASCFEGLCSKHAQCVENISNYTCKCNPGFTGPNCTEAVQCPSIATVPSNGRMNCSHSTNSYNTICMFSCDEGFELRGSHTTLCDHTGQWTHNTPTCTASCFEGLCRKHAQCVEKISNYTCKCNPGFTGPKCTEAVQCPSIATVPSNGRMNCSHSTNSYNTICMFSCDEGFELRGSHTTLCDHTGQWTHNTPTCTVVMLCKSLSVLGGGIVSCYRGNSTICTVQCPSDYLLLGAGEHTCRPDGSWSQFQPLCASYKHMLMALSGFAAFSTMCCYIFCYSYCRKRKKASESKLSRRDDEPSM